MNLVGSETVEVRRSRKRTRTVSAYRRDGRVVVMIPDRFSAAEEAEWVAKMIARLDRPSRRRGRLAASDADLAERARRLSAEHLDGLAVPTSVRWVTNQHKRWGSCTPSEGSIRLSHRLRDYPDYVLDAVLVHELAHLLVSGHGPRFWAWADRYPQAERAKGFLEAAALGAGTDPARMWDDEFAEESPR